MHARHMMMYTYILDAASHVYGEACHSPVQSIQQSLCSAVQVLCLADCILNNKVLSVEYSCAVAAIRNLEDAFAQAMYLFVLRYIPEHTCSDHARCTCVSKQDEHTVSARFYTCMVRTPFMAHSVCTDMHVVCQPSHLSSRLRVSGGL